MIFVNILFESTVHHIAHTRVIVGGGWVFGQKRGPYCYYYLRVKILS